MEFDRAVFDSFESVVHELREQLRAREVLELTSANQREFLREREAEVDVLRAEVEALRKQKDALVKALQAE